MNLFKTPITKNILLLCITVLALAPAGKAQVFVAEDFNLVTNPNLPSGWSSSPAAFWVTGVPNTIAPNAMALKSVSFNKTGHSKAVGIDGSQPSADNAVLALPMVSLPSSATDAVLNFDVAFLGADYNGIFESLVLEVSTDGGANWSYVSFIGQISDPFGAVWETRSMSLGSFAGQSNLTFGIRYHNQGNVIIGAALDNIRIVSGPDGTAVSALAGHNDHVNGQSYLLSGSSVAMTGKVKNEGTTTIHNYYIKYKVGSGAVQSSALVSTTLAPLATENFPAGLSVTIPSNANYPIKAWIEVVGDVNPGNDTAYTTTIGLPYLPVKRPVFEEGTGTWCGWCPRGNSFMERFAQNHPSGDAAQIAVHDGDPMTVSAYNNYMSVFYSGFPSLLVDRHTVNDPKTIDSCFTEALTTFGFADFFISAPTYSGNIATVTVSITPVVTLSHARVALVITESNVAGTGSNWAQNNYYSGGGNGSMGGWENEPSHVDNVNFHFVARSISPYPGGAIGNLPATLLAGTTYTNALTTTLDASWKISDLQYIALLINGADTSIMNSTFTALPTLKPTFGNVTGIGVVEGNREQAVLYPNPTADKSHLVVTMKQGGSASLTLSDMTGRQLLQRSVQLAPGSNTIELETQGLAAGSYIVNLSNEQNYVHLKLQVVK